MASIPNPRVAPLLRATIHALFNYCGGITVYGAENIPTLGPVLFCPNHQSDCDPLALFVATPRRDIYFMAKEELFTNPRFGALLGAFGTFPVKRDSADRAAIRHAERILEDGNALVVFPEGRLSETGCLLSFQSGAAMIALRSGATVVPVGLAHTREILPYSHLIPRQSRIAARVCFGNPITMDQFKDMKSRVAMEKLTKQIEREIRRLTGLLVLRPVML